MAGVGPLVAGIAKGIGVFFTAQGALWTVARVVTAVAATALLSKRLAGYDPGIAGRAITIRGTVEPQVMIYGEALVSGVVFWNEVSGEKGRYLWGAIALAGHEVEAITDVWLDGEVIPNSIINGGAAAGGAVTSGLFGPQDGTDVVELYKHYGTAAQTVNAQLDAEFTAWTTAHRARGIAYGVTKFNNFNRSEKIWDNKEPTNIKWLVKGRKLYDPRLDSTNGGSGTHRYADPTTWEWSDNPALCVADYLIDDRFGMNLDPATRIDWSAIVTAADYCDASSTIPGGSETRYTCNGTLVSTATHRDNLAAILSSCNGELTVSAGLWTLRIGYLAPDVSLTADDVIAPLGISRTLPRAERFNEIVAQFIDSEDEYSVVETPKVDDGGSFRTGRDNGVGLLEEIELPMTNKFYMAQRLAFQQLQIADLERQVSTTLNLKAAQQAVGGRINLTVGELSWNPEVFKIQQWELMDTGDEEDGIGVKVELRQDSASAYADPLLGDYTTRNANGTFTPADPAVPPPTSLTATPGLQGGIDWAWANPADFQDWDEVVLYTSPNSSWASAVETWRGRADAVNIQHPAGQEFWGWVRIESSGEQSLRNPNSDTSTVSAVSPEYTFPNRMPAGYSDFCCVDENNITVSDNGGTNNGSWLIQNTGGIVGDGVLEFQGPTNTALMDGGLQVGFYTPGSGFNVNYPNQHRQQFQVVAWYYPVNADALDLEITWRLQGASVTAASKPGPNLAGVRLGDIPGVQTGQYQQLSFAIDASTFTETQFRVQLEVTNKNEGTAPASPQLRVDGIMVIDTSDVIIAPDVAES